MIDLETLVPGAIVYAQPGLAIMYLKDNKFLLGEQVIELSEGLSIMRVPNEFRITEDFTMGLILGLSPSTKSIPDKVTLNNTDQVKGYIYALHMLPGDYGQHSSYGNTSSPRIHAWNRLDIFSMLALEPYVGALIAASALVNGLKQFPYKSADEFAEIESSLFEEFKAKLLEEQEEQ